jgi:hypothetical protein
MAVTSGTNQFQEADKDSLGISYFPCANFKEDDIDMRLQSELNY